MNNFCLKLPSIAAHRIFDLKNISFSLEHFSEFKHGSELYSKLFAKDLYEKFKESIFMKDLEGKDIRIYSSPYSELATASLHLTKAFIQYLESDKSFIPKSIGHHKIRRIQI